MGEQTIIRWFGDLTKDDVDSVGGKNASLGNPTIFASAVAGSDAYADDLRDLAASGATAEQAARRLTVDDIRSACDLLAPVAQRTDGVDGRVSLEVDPRLAHDTKASIDEARQLWTLVDRPNLFIKIPATPAGLPAITRCIAEGISINVTLVFSLARYEAVVDAYWSGLEQRLTTGASLEGIESVASFFVSRVDTEVDRRLEEIGTDEALALRGRAAIANARLAYQRYEQRIGSPRWLKLASAGAQVQRPLWASRAGRTRRTRTRRTCPGSSLPTRSAPCRSRRWRLSPSCPTSPVEPSPAPTRSPGASSTPFRRSGSTWTT